MWWRSLGIPYWVTGGTPEHTHHIPLPDVSGSWRAESARGADCSGARKRARSQAKGTRPRGTPSAQVRSGQLSVALPLLDPSQGGGAFRVLIQTDDERQTTDDYDKHWEPLFRVRFGGVPAHDRLASRGECRTLGPRLEVQTDIQTDERNTLYQTQFYLQPAHHWAHKLLTGSAGLSRVLIKN